MRWTSQRYTADFIPKQQNNILLASFHETFSRIGHSYCLLVAMSNFFSLLPKPCNCPSSSFSYKALAFTPQIGHFSGYCWNRCSPNCKSLIPSKHSSASGCSSCFQVAMGTSNVSFPFLARRYRA